MSVKKSLERRDEIARRVAEAEAREHNNRQCRCWEIYTCCDCGGTGCGCAYCWSCNACDECRQDN